MVEPSFFSVSGDVEKPGNYEIPMGTSSTAKLLELAGGVKTGRKLKAVIPGGSSMPVLPADIMMSVKIWIMTLFQKQVQCWDLEL